MRPSLPLHRVAPSTAGVFLLLALFVLAGAPSDAQPSTAQCDKAYEQGLADFTATPTIIACAEAGNREGEAMLGMIHWSASAHRQCELDGPCFLGHPASHGLDPSLTIEELQSAGRRLLEIAAGKGHVIAQNELGLAFLDGDHGQPRDPVEARRYLTLASNAGDEIAPYNLARIYFGGLGVERSIETGEALLRLSAHRGYRPAKCSLMAWQESRTQWRSPFESGIFAALKGVANYCAPGEIMDELMLDGSEATGE